MRIALAQIDTTVGAIAHNVRLVAEAYDRAAAQQAELVVFPELTLTGYPPKDLLDHASFIERNLEALDEAAALTAGAGKPGMIVGFVDRAANDHGKGLHNAAALIDAGRVVSRHYKTLLPTYDVFDEARHFDPAPERRLAEFRGRRIAVTICEDFWNDRLYWSRRIYPIDPIEELAGQSPDFFVTISASPYAMEKPQIRAGMYRTAAKKHGVPIVHANLVGGNDGLIFDGRSNIWSGKGELLAHGAACREDLQVFDLDNVAAPPDLKDPTLMPTDDETNEEVYLALTLGLRDYCHKCRFENVVIGLSGGIDSALTAVLAADALGPEHVTGIAMPSQYSSDHSVTDAEALARNLGIRYREIAIRGVYDRYLEALEPLFKDSPFGLAEENLQARIRGAVLMSISNKFGWLVVTTGNKSELAVGYCTLYGDMVGGLAVLSDVLKTRVYSLARWINRDRERIPRHTLEKPPSAELRPNQLDTDSLPPYEQLDRIIEAYVEELKSPREIVALGFSEEIVRRVIGMIDRNEYKRQQAPVGLKVTSKAFGIGRRMPIARGEW